MADHQTCKEQRNTQQMQDVEFAMPRKFFHKPSIAYIARQIVKKFSIIGVRMILLVLNHVRLVKLGKYNKVMEFANPIRTMSVAQIYLIARNVLSMIKVKKYVQLVHLQSMPKIWFLSYTKELAITIVRQELTHPQVIQQGLCQLASLVRRIFQIVRIVHLQVQKYYAQDVKNYQIHSFSGRIQ